MKTVTKVDIAYLKQCFRYEDGKIFWREDRPLSHFYNEKAQRTFNTMYAGKEAATSINTTHQYHQVNLKGTVLLRAWIIWVLCKGEYPKRSIKRRDGDRTNDEIGNLYITGDK